MGKDFLMNRVDEAIDNEEEVFVTMSNDKGSGVQIAFVPDSITAAKSSYMIYCGNDLIRVGFDDLKMIDDDLFVSGGFELAFS